MFHAQELGSYAQGQGSLAVFKVTARDQGHYKGPRSPKRKRGNEKYFKINEYIISRQSNAGIFILRPFSFEVK